jgi:hypothetical protein
VALNQPKLRRVVVIAFALFALGAVVWMVLKPSGFALLASIFLTVQAGLLFWMARLQNKLRK